MHPTISSIRKIFAGIGSQMKDFEARARAKGRTKGIPSAAVVLAAVLEGARQKVRAREIGAEGYLAP